MNRNGTERGDLFEKLSERLIGAEGTMRERRRVCYRNVRCNREQFSFVAEEGGCISLRLQGNLSLTLIDVTGT